MQIQAGELPIFTAATHILRQQMHICGIVEMSKGFADTKLSTYRDFKILKGENSIFLKHLPGEVAAFISGRQINSEFRNVVMDLRKLISWLVKFIFFVRKLVPLTEFLKRHLK